MYDTLIGQVNHSMCNVLSKCLKSLHATDTPDSIPGEPKQRERSVLFSHLKIQPFSQGEQVTQQATIAAVLSHNANLNLEGKKE